MAKIQVGGAGGAPSNNFIRSLRECRRNDYLIGMSSVATDLFLADVEERHVVPYANDPSYPEKLLNLIRQARPDFLHVQHDFEVLAVSALREQIQAEGVRLYLPSHETIKNCVNKQSSYECWKRAGIKVPETVPLNNPADLRSALEHLGPRIWIRAVKGAAGHGSLPTENFEFARIWIDHFKGWGEFIAAKCLTARTVTWLSIWFRGELVVAQTRRRHTWSFGNRTLSGVTGITGVGETCSFPLVDQIAKDAIFAIDREPHGIFAVDMTYDEEGIPNPTEINIGRFFTTHYFFTKAGLNMPEIYCNIALDNRFPDLERKINPLPDGLLWIRGMDVEPVLTTVEEVEKLARRELEAGNS